MSLENEASALREVVNSNRSVGFLRTFLPTIFAVIVMCAGWIFNYATNTAELRDHERRIAVIEAQYVPRSEHIVEDKARNERMDEQDRRLGRIEEKLDALLASRAYTH